MYRVEEVLKYKAIDDPDNYIERNIDGDYVSARAIEDEDIELALFFDNDIVINHLLMSRCINRVNGIKRDDWDLKDWSKFILSLNWKDKYLFFQEIRRITYYEKKYNHPIYF